MGACNSCSASIPGRIRRRRRPPPLPVARVEWRVGGGDAFTNSQVSLCTRLSGRAALSVSESTLYRCIKFLPVSARLILRVIESATRFQKLVETYGGDVIRVPLGKYSNTLPLASVLGVRAMQRFVAAYGGTDVYIPVCAEFLRRVRNFHILYDYAQLQKKGFSIRTAVQHLSTRYALSIVSIRSIVQNMPCAECSGYSEQY